MAINLHPSNDFAVTIKLQKVDPVTAVKSALTDGDGAVTAFLAVSNSPTVVAADPSLSVTATHLASGKWLVFFDASALTPALLASLFASTTPYLVIEMPAQVRVYVALEYDASRPATVT